MLSLPTKALRMRAAAMLAAAYAFCVLAPSLAFAFADGAAVPFCLTDDHMVARQHANTVHVHADVAAHHHSGPDTSHEHSAPRQHPDHGMTGNPGDCCGLFPMTGLSGESRISFEPSNLVSVAFPVPSDALHGRGPDRINRPPIG
jgi:hypothetical protein